MKDLLFFCKLVEMSGSTECQTQGTAACDLGKRKSSFKFLSLESID